MQRQKGGTPSRLCEHCQRHPGLDCLSEDERVGRPCTIYAPLNGTHHPSADEREAIPSSRACASLAIPSCRSIKATSPYTRQALRSHPALQGGGEGGQALEQGQINTHAKQVPHSQTAASQSPSPLTCSSSGQPAVQAARTGPGTASAMSVRRAAATLTARPGLPEGRTAARPLVPLGGADPASRARVSSELRRRPKGEECSSSSRGQGGGQEKPHHRKSRGEEHSSRVE